MNRRKFVYASAGVSLLGPHVATVVHAGTPCAPGAAVQGQSPPPVLCGEQAPSWFLNQAEGTWLEVGGGAGQTISDHIPSPTPIAGTGSPSGITSAWTGAAVDPSRREYMMVANGGHADYAGNEGYAINLGEETPQWRRLNDPTPNSQLSLDISGPAFSDGRAKTMHSGNQVFGDGRVWYPIMNSVTSRNGGHSSTILSFDRGYAGLPDNHTQAPLPWTSDNIGPWTFHGSGPSSQSIGFGYGVYDPVEQRVYGLANGGSSANFILGWYVSTAPGSLGQMTELSRGLGWNLKPNWAVLCPDLRLIVCGNFFDDSLSVLNLNNHSWQRVTNITGSGGISSRGGGGVYVQANHTIAVSQPKSNGTTIYRLQIPTSGGSYARNGQWQWTTLNPTGASFSFPGGNNEAFSKWNLVPDMGNGQAAIVYASDITRGLFVYKVPPGGL